MANAGGRELEYFFVDRVAVVAFPDQPELAGARYLEVCATILVTKGMTADNDRIGPARYETRNIVDHDWFAEYDAAENVANGAVWRFPHPFQAEFLDPVFVGCDRRAFYANAVLLDRIGRVDRDFVICVIADLDGKVIIMQINVEIRFNQPLANPLPDDASHFVAVNFDDRVFDLDFRHIVYFFPETGTSREE